MINIENKVVSSNKVCMSNLPTDVLINILRWLPLSYLYMTKPISKKFNNCANKLIIENIKICKKLENKFLKYYPQDTNIVSEIQCLKIGNFNFKYDLCEPDREKVDSLVNVLCEESIMLISLYEDLYSINENFQFVNIKLAMIYVHGIIIKTPAEQTIIIGSSHEKAEDVLSKISGDASMNKAYSKLIEIHKIDDSAACCVTAYSY